MAESGKHTLLVAANRGPVSISAGPGGKEEVRRGGGGLVSGMVSALSEVGGLWVCAALSDRERVAARRAPDGHLAEAEYDTGGLDVRMLPLDPSTFSRAYNGIANSTIWFVQHLLYDSANAPVFDAGWRRLWAAYERYNRSFADALADEAAPGAKVMVQDYHLNLVPRQLRERRDDVRIAHFTHTPWAPPEQFGWLPEAVVRELLTGLLGADHLGFHCARWADAFLACCSELLGADVNRSARTVHWEGRTVRVGLHGLGTSAEELTERAGQDDVEAGLAHLRDLVGDRKVIVRVDRAELSKNIVRGLIAYRELLRSRPEWHGRVVHVAYEYPSRTDIPEYREYTAAVQRVGREIEQEFGTDDWDPLLLEVANDYPASLAALRMGDVLLVNPVRDGMNLVAKEGVILSERDCAVVLSRDAGVADEYAGDALMVNPYDVTETAEALHAALSMPAAERQDRRKRLLAAATALPPGQWFRQQLDALD
ncbi:MAG TPA: trehalose-6-phosphate synthase [Mycobacteriales bacterium]|jgi:trehalose 6-phosphate synthase|nr:trehalose-6-phosphate synthase [Mycobacteriales bacterium]